MSKSFCRECEAKAPMPKRSKAEEKKELPSEDKGSYADVVKAGGADQRAVAAAKVAELEQAILQLGENPILAAAKADLEKELAKQQRLAKDNRSTAKKLDQKQAWAERETKRIAVETKRIEEARATLQRRQAALEAELASIEKLKSDLLAVGPEAMDNDDTLSPEAVAELKHMEEKELNLRRGVARKRAVGSPAESPNVEASVLQSWEAEANALLEQIESKRKRLRSNPAAAATTRQGPG
jgi:hypothetical protein